MKKFFSDKIAITIFVLPALLIFTIMIFIPILQVFWKSLFDWDGLSTPIFIGLDNYKRLVTDTVFYTANKNGFIFAGIITFFQIILATTLAIALSNAKVKGRKILRISYFIPVVLSVTVVCQLWLSIYNADTGLLNKFFEAIGIDYRQNWLSDPSTAIFPIAVVNGWQWMGYQFALILAGIKSIPEHYYEAAQIDGATNLQAHIKVTIPLLADTYQFCLVLAITGGIKAFTEMFIMTGGGPGTSTYTLTYMMYGSAFKSGQFGYGMAAASVLVIECLVAILIINRLFKKYDVSQ